jgi:hypothetical protein
MKKKSAYYSHSMRKYNSIKEDEEFEFIQKHFKGDVICPNKHLGDLGAIEPYLKVIETTSAVYATELIDYVGIGVFEECSFALSKKIPVFVVRKDSNKNYYVLPLKSVSKIESPTLMLFGRLITEKDSKIRRNSNP